MKILKLVVEGNLEIKEKGGQREETEISSLKNSYFGQKKKKISKWELSIFGFG